VFGGAAQETVWAEPLLPTGQDEFGCYWDVPVTQGVDLECIVHRGDEKDVEARVPQDWSNGAWMVTGQGVFGHAPDLGSFPMGNLQKACAAWVDETTLLWHGAAEGADGTAHKFSLVAGRELEVVTGGDGVVGQDTERIPLEVVRFKPVASAPLHYHKHHTDGVDVDVDLGLLTTATPNRASPGQEGFGFLTSNILC
jgi:hypothetical protein